MQDLRAAPEGASLGESLSWCETIEREGEQRHRGAQQCGDAGGVDEQRDAERAPDRCARSSNGCGGVRHARRLLHEVGCTEMASESGHQWLPPTTFGERPG